MSVNWSRQIYPNTWQQCHVGREWLPCARVLPASSICLVLVSFPKRISSRLLARKFLHPNFICRPLRLRQDVRIVFYSHLFARFAGKRYLFFFSRLFACFAGKSSRAR